MGVSIQTQTELLLSLVVALVVLVLGQVAIRPARPSGTEDGGTGRKHVVWAATPLALGMSLAGALLLLVPFAVASGSVPDSFLVAWVLIWGLVPCAILGYLSGRWWSFAGAAPMLVLWPFGLVVGSTSEDVVTNADLFFALPATAAMAVALSLGAAVRSWRTQGNQPSAVASDIALTPPVSEPTADQPPFWPPPRNWTPTPTDIPERERSFSQTDPPDRHRSRSLAKA